MNASRFFRLANRTNSILLLAILAVAAVALLAAGVSELSSHLGRHRPEARGAGSGGEERFELQAPVVIEGTGVTVVPLGGARDSKGFSSGDGWSWTANLLFHDLSTGRSRWLRPKGDGAILGWEVLREGELPEQYDESGGRGARGKGAPLAIRYELAEEDTDGDGAIGAGDRLAVALSSVSGDGLAIVLREVEEIRGYSAPVGGKLAIFFRRGEQDLVAEVELAGRRLLREAPIPAQ